MLTVSFEKFYGRTVLLNLESLFTDFSWHIEVVFKILVATGNLLIRSNFALPMHVNELQISTSVLANESY